MIEKYEILEIGKVLNQKTGRILKTDLSPSGHHRVILCINGQPKRYYLHRLVATEHVPNPDNKPFINHKDGNKNNNHKSNLEWVTCQENTIHAFEIGLRSRGEDATQAKLSNELVHEVCGLISAGFIRGDVLKHLPINKTQFDDIRRRKSWKHISKNYMW